MLAQHLVNDVSTDDFSTSAEKGILLGSSTLARLNTQAQPFCHGWLNRAIGNASISELMAYLQWSPAHYRPALIYIYAGDNDLARGQTVNDVAAHYQTLIDKVNLIYESPDIHLLAVKKAPARKAMWAAVDALNNTLSAKADNSQHLHFHWHFAKPEQPSFARYFADDGIHLTALGYQYFLQGVPTLCD